MGVYTNVDAYENVDVKLKRRWMLLYSRYKWEMKGVDINVVVDVKV